MVDFYKVPVYELNRIKNGADFVTPEGEVIPNHRLTRPSAPARKYAYCSDTIYRPEIVEQIKGIDLLFHEATFAQTEQVRARETHHTTAAQAAQIALNAEVKQLVIGHFSARYEDESVLLNEAAAIFPQTVLARENMCITINNYTDTRDYDPYNEREVLKLLQEESTQRKGFELIVAQYSEQLYWQIRRMVLSHEDANDLLQNTFIKAWTNIDYFRAGRSCLRGSTVLR